MQTFFAVSPIIAYGLCGLLIAIGAFLFFGWGAYCGDQSPTVSTASVKILATGMFWGFFILVGTYNEILGPNLWATAIAFAVVTGLGLIGLPWGILSRVKREREHADRTPDGSSW